MEHGKIPSPVMGEMTATGRTAEAQSRTVKRPLLSVAMITRAGNQMHLGEDEAFTKHMKTGQVTHLRLERNVWMLDLCVKRPGNAVDVSSFQRLGR